ncbi:class I SAM-dependent methyltransferase [Candidatus Omnitrophota bacterium]
MIKKIYYWFHNKTSKPEERGEYSAGRWQDAVRKKTLELCRGKQGRVLEVGCGEGLFLIALAGISKDAQIYGVDNWGEILQRAGEKKRKKKLKRIQLSQADAKRLPFKSKRFDAVVCINVIFNLKSWNATWRVLHEMVRVCNKGGSIIFDIRNTMNFPLYFKYKFAKYYDATVKDLPLKTYALPKITATLKKHNFEVVKRAPVGFPHNIFAPILIIEARRK